MGFSVSVPVAAGAAGVSGTLMDGGPSATPASKGTTAFFGAYQRGPSDVALLHSGKSNYLRRRGSTYQDEQTPLCTEDWFGASEGRSQLITYRVTDGDEQYAALLMKDRNVELGELRLIGAQSEPGTVATVTSAFKGASYGRGKLRGGYVADVSAVIAGSVFTPEGTAMVANRYKGCKFSVKSGGSDYSFTVSSNTTTTITVQEGFGAMGTLAAVSATWTIYVEEIVLR